MRREHAQAPPRCSDLQTLGSDPEMQLVVLPGGAGRAQARAPAPPHPTERAHPRVARARGSPLGTPGCMQAPAPPTCALAKP